VSTSIRVISRSSSPEYPARLRGLADGPELLYLRGAPGEPALSVAIVGARAASGHAMATARALAAEVARAGGVVLSGGAVGVDAAAHRGALGAGGRTVSVLACGLDAPYPPQSRPLFDEICAGGGAIVSPFGPGTPPRRFHFVRRNRILAAMADAVVVVEAGLGSGALYTAQSARELGRVLGASPGTPGCEALIAQGAAVVESGDDLFQALAGRPRRPEVSLPIEGSEEARVLAALEPEAPAGTEALSARTGLGARDLARVLTGLELEGLALLLPGRTYVRSVLAQELLKG
jgi:DNA processing protein